MSFNIREFIGNVNRYGTLPTNRYEVLIDPARIMLGDSVLSRLQYRAESVSIPGITLDTTDTRRWGIGPREKFGTNVNFSDINITFIEEDGNNIHKYMYRWMNSIFRFAGQSESSTPSYYSEYKDNYATTMTINVFNKTQDVTESVQLQEVFPTGLSEISLGWADNNQLFKVRASFAFTRWRINSTPGSSFNSPFSTGQIRANFEPIQGP